MERIYLDKTAFMLCRDIHPGTDTRYLVIFKDTSLKTIRDLTHFPVLETSEVASHLSSDSVVMHFEESTDESKFAYMLTYLQRCMLTYLFTTAVTFHNYIRVQ